MAEPGGQPALPVELLVCCGAALTGNFCGICGKARGAKEVQKTASTLKKSKLINGIKAKKREKAKIAGLPWGAFGVFLAKNRGRFKAMCREGKSQSTVASETWKGMSADERLPYQQQFDALKQKHKEEQLRLACAKAEQAEKKRKHTDDHDAGQPVEVFKRLRPDNLQAFLPPFSQALFQGLQGAAELNGEKCEVIAYDRDAGRYLVKMENGTEDKRVRPEHLVPCLSIGTTVVCLPVSTCAQPGELINLRGHVEGYESKERKYRVRFADTPEAADVRPSEVSTYCAPAEMILLQGLQGSQELNGCEAVVQSFDDTKGRYLVKVTKLGNKSEGMRVRPECVRPRLRLQSKVIIHGLVSAADFNGMLAEVKGYEESTGRYVLSLVPKQEPEQVASQAFQPNRAWIRTNVEVTVWGDIKSSPELVGQLASVEEFDADIGHYLIRCRKSLKASFVKHENLCQWFAPGTRVVIHRMSKLNGHLATVESFIAGRGCYFVRFDKFQDNSQIRQLKAEALCKWYAAGTKVLLRGLPNSPKLDNQIACVQGFDHERGRYLVHLEKNQKRTSLLRAEHLHTLLARGSVVKLDGLQAEPELNGTFGKVMKRFDVKRCQYTVRLFGGSEFKSFPPDVLCAAVSGEYNEEEANEQEALAEASDAESSSSIDSGDILDRLPAPASPASSTSSSSDSQGFRKKHKETQAPKLSRHLMRTMVAKTMKGIAKAEQSTSSV